MGTKGSRGYAGYVTGFQVKNSYLERHEVHEVGGSELREYWIPAEEREENSMPTSKERSKSSPSYIRRRP